MTPALPIPSDYLDLVSLLRFAVNKRPPDTDLSSADWPHILKQARQHGVDAFLYPWLAEHLPLFFSPKANVASNSAPAAWRALFFESVSRAALRQRQLSEILEAFACANLAVIPLKGAWLSETVYDDPSQRNMSDLDLLVCEHTLETCHEVFLSLGYLFTKNVLKNPYFHDQKYYHPDQPYVVEAHWQFTSSQEPTILPPDIDTIWHRTTESHLFGQPVRLMSTEDQLAHLVQHGLRHGFAMHLRGYLDIALLLKHSGENLNSDELHSVSSCWKIGCGMMFTLAMVANLFALSPLNTFCTHIPIAYDTKYALASSIMFNLPIAGEQKCEAQLLSLKHKSLLGRLRLLQSHIFLPRVLLAAIYPCACHPCGLPLAWLYRTSNLLTRYQKKIGVSLAPINYEEQSMVIAERRESLVKWLLGQTPSP